ncbi:MAG: hypothetical protein JKX96_11230 [Acinetobacter sp.]|nr:hypothetical protein [Acinetobacter sp.]
MPSVRTATDAGLGQIGQTGAGSTPKQNFSTSIDMFGSAQAQRAKEVGSILDEQANKMIRAEDERASMEIEQDIRDWQFEATQGEDGVYRKRGGGAIGSTKAIQENYGKFSANLLRGRVVSAKARQRIEEYIGQKGDGIREEVNRYEQQQKTIYDNGLREARIQGSKEDAIIYYNDPQKLAESESRIRSTMRRSAEANGWSPEETAQQIESEVSSMHKGVIDRMLAQKLGSDARQYLEKNRKEIDGKDIIAIEKAVRVGVVSQVAQNATDTIMNQDMTQTEALAKARADYSGKERDEIVKRIKVRYSEETTLETAQTKALLKSGWDIISKGGTPDDLSPTELAAAGRQVDSMWTMAKNSKSRGKGFSLTSETGIVQEYLGKTDAEIVAEDLTALQPKVTEADWNKVSKRQNDAERAIKELKDRPGQGSTVERLLKEFSPKSWKVGKEKASSARRAQAQRARDSMNEYISNTIDKTGKLPTEGDMRKESSRILIQIQEDGLLWFNPETVVGEQGDTPLHKLIMDEEVLIQASGVPKENLEAVKGFIRSQGQPITINNMIKVWDSRSSK